MVKYIIFAVIVLVAFHATTAKPRAKAAAAAAPAEKSQLEELAATAQNLVNNVTATLGLNELTDSKKVTEALNAQAQTLATNVQGIVDKLKSEASSHQGEFDNAIKSVQEKLSQTVTNLQEIAGPQATAKANEIRTNFDASLKTTVAQVEKLVKAVEPDATKAKASIEAAAKTLLDQIIEVSQNVQNQVKASIAEHEKTHKH